MDLKTFYFHFLWKADKETHRDPPIFMFTPQVPAIDRAEPRQSPDLELNLVSHVCGQGAKNLNHHLVPPWSEVELAFDPGTLMWEYLDHCTKCIPYDMEF